MKNYLRINIYGLILLVAFIIQGCGYRRGYVIHPQIKTIGVANVKNNSKEPMLSSYMKQSLGEQFQFNGALKVVNQYDSSQKVDCIVYTEITEVTTSSTGNDSAGDDDSIYVPAKWSVNVSAKFTVIIPGTATPFVKTRTVSGSASYEVLADHRVNRKRGLQQACRNIAREIVSYTTEAW